VRGMGDATTGGMRLSLLRKLVVGVAMAVALGGSSACTVAELPPPQSSDGYDPQFYDGYVVYYDDIGRPYYYVDGTQVWLSVSSPAYGSLLNYWRVHRAGYPRWYSYYGYRYRGYRYSGH
jgi:hypothetical protein